MDSLAHRWAIGFRKFHPKAKVVISTEGSETVFARLIKNPASIGMLSRPISSEDLDRLKAGGLSSSHASVRRLNLRGDAAVFDGDQHEVLLGRYPIIRPFSLVFDLGVDGQAGIANRELARFALTQAGQTQVILDGFAPCAPPTLRGQLAVLQGESSNDAP